MSAGTDAPGTGYAPGGTGRDEMVGADGDVRAAWLPVARELAERGPERLGALANGVRRRLVAHGTTFQIHGAGEQPWELDPVPLVIAGLEWSGLALALTQRALVIERVLADLHGPRRLLRSGSLPAEALVAHDGLLLPTLDLPPPGGRHLVTYAADVLRGADGRFRLLEDRVDVPVGMGYVLENRAALGDTYGERFRAFGVRRLAPWFERLRLALERSAPPGIDEPRIVLLGSGPAGESGFEEALLARTLGYTLVQGPDLAIRGGHAYVKALGGLEPVHVIARRIRSGDVDPLEIRTSNLGGVAGLLEATRLGNVSVVNPPGVGVAENPALLHAITALTREVLGEEPLIEAVPTWWCGEPSERSHVLANLDRLVLKPVDHRPGRRSIFARTLSSEALVELRDRIEAQPARWVGQEEVELPTAPMLAADGALVSGHVVQRAFAAADEDGFSFLEGSLARAAPQREALTPLRGGRSKDTWVVDDAELRSRRARVLPRLPQIDLRDSITSHTAESMFWMGRNLERADLAARTASAAARLVEDWPDLRDEADGWWARTTTEVVTAIIGHAGPTGDGDEPDPTQLDDVVQDALHDRVRPRSVPTSLDHLLSGARSVREMFSIETWRTLGELAEPARTLGDRDATSVPDLAPEVLRSLAALSGLLAESMVRDPGWRFLDAGRRIERCRLLCSTLDAAMTRVPPDAVAGPTHELVLVSWDSLVAYRRRHRSDIAPTTMLELLLTDVSNPRSLAAGLDRLGEDLAALPGGAPDAPTATLVRCVDRLAAAGVSSGALVRAGADGRRGALHDLTSTTRVELGELADQLQLACFAHVRTATVALRPEGAA